MQNRYYDPSVGSFVSVDPLVGRTGHPYLYANGNPTTLSDPNGLDPDTDARIRDRAKSDGFCTKSASVSVGNVCGPMGVYYGKINLPAAGTGARDGGVLPVETLPEMVAPACASLGPDADQCSLPQPEITIPQTTGTAGANQDLLYEFGKAGLGAALEAIGESEALQACGESMGLGPACDYADEMMDDNYGPDKADEMAKSQLIDFAHATAVYACGTSASGATVTCVDSQRIPVLSWKMNRVTYGHYIFCEGRCTADAIIHEFVHVDQYERESDAMMVRYLLSTALHGYEGSSYEQEANDVHD